MLGFNSISLNLIFRGKAKPSILAITYSLEKLEQTMWLNWAKTSMLANLQSLKCEMTHSGMHKNCSSKSFTLLPPAPIDFYAGCVNWMLLVSKASFPGVF